VLRTLLHDADARAAMQAAQAAFAARWGTAEVAARLAELLAQPAWQGVGGAGA
jgi:hypothetical protein